jgi:hypothetical protein
MFDFSKYYKKMSGKTDAKIELKDVPIKSDSSASTDDGDTTLNEYVTRNIDYIITGIALGDYSRYYGTTRYFDGSNDDKKSMLVQSCSVIDEDGNESEDRYAFRVGSSLGDAEYEVPRPGGTLISSVQGFAHYDDDASVDQKVPLVMSVVPKYTLIANPQPVATDEDVYAHAMAMFGLLGSGCETLKWATSGKYKKKNCVLSYSTLERRMSKVARDVRENKFEVEVSTYYDLVDPNAAPPPQGQNPVDVTVPSPVLPRTMTASTIVKGANTAAFCTRMQNYGYMIDCTGDNKTPFLPSLRDAFEAYYPKEEVAEDFEDAFEDVLEGIKSLWVLKKSLKSSTRSKIKAVSAQDFRNATAEEINFTAPGETFLIDIESLKCKYEGDGWNRYVSIVSPYYANGTYKFRRYLFNRVDTSVGKYVYVDMSVDIGKTIGSLKDAYGDSNFEHAMLSYTEYSMQDFYTLLVETYDQSVQPRPSGVTRCEYLANILNHVIVGMTTPVENAKYSSFSVPPVMTAVVVNGQVDEAQTAAMMESWVNSHADMKVKVVDWYKGADLDEDKEWSTSTKRSDMVPLLQQDSSITATNLSLKLKIVDDVDDIVDKFDAAIIAMAFFQPAAAALLRIKLNSLKRSVDEFNRVVNRIKYFEYYTADSVFESKERILSDAQCYRVENGIPITAKFPARMLIATRLYKKVKRRKRFLCFWRTITKTKFIGVRWTEIRFINVGLYSKYPKDMRIPERMIPFESSYTYGSTVIVTNEIPSDLEAGKKVTLKVSGYNDEVAGTITDAHTITLDKAEGIPKTGTTQYFKVGLDDTKSGDETTQVNIEYNLPYFPYDEEIRGYAFGSYGPFDQSRYAIKDRSGSFGSGKDGWKIFFDTSKEISSLRKGINIYPTVAHLIRILRDEFGENRVELVETTRSVDDQRARCLGGSESAFLSWHNYGLAAKIMIYGDDNKTPIKDGSDDMMKLIEIARTFTDDCLKGKYGARFNVVWCGRLTVGADLFDWEFLPIGVNHKDAPKFRDSLISQRDPIVDFSYVPATKYAKTPSSELLKDKNTPWFPKNSAVYNEADSYGGVKYVNPKSIRNFKFPKNLPLINLIEYIRMIQLKMDAYGTKMPNKGDMYEWINKNKTAYQQLLVYFGMMGNLQSFRALLAGEYITRYKPVVSSYYSTDPIAFVKNFLGEEYEKVQIRAQDMIDASYITLADGRLHIPCGDGRPNLPLSVDNMYDQKQVTKDNYERGRWVDGLFVPATKEDEYVSQTSVIGGYNNFVAVGGDAYILHSFIADQIKQEFDAIVKMFEGYNGELMFDSFYNGPYADKFEQLENEFGIIAKQDLIDFDQLKGMLTVADLNEQTNGTAITTKTGDDGTEYKDIYEKVISNAEVAGMKLASLSSAHLEVNPPKAETVTIEDVYKILNNGNAPTANDIVNFRRNRD